MTTNVYNKDEYGQLTQKDLYEQITEDLQLEDIKEKIEETTAAILQQAIEEQVQSYFVMNGKKPTMVTMSNDVYTSLLKSFDRGYVENTVSDTKPCAVRGLVIGVLPNSNIRQYLKVS